jgi:hypothetical protein
MHNSHKKELHINLHNEHAQNEHRLSASNSNKKVIPFMIDLSPINNSNSASEQDGKTPTFSR